MQLLQSISSVFLDLEVEMDTTEIMIKQIQISDFTENILGNSFIASHMCLLIRSYIG